MRAPFRIPIRRGSLLLAIAAAAVLVLLAAAGRSLLATQTAQADPGVADAETINLCADEGTINLPGVADPVPIWGFSLATGGSCGTPTLPGPELGVDVGDAVTVNLQNNLAEPVSIAFPGQDIAAEPVTPVAPGSTGSYQFTAGEPGTFIYEAGANNAVQLAMGLYGALIVRPIPPGQAYGDATTYDVDEVLVLSEIDTNLNFTPNPNDFDFVGDPDTYTAGYHPTYFLINGETYPAIDTITAVAGERVLLRYVNASPSHHTMTVLGKHQQVVAKDAYPTDNRFDAVAETIPAGSTLDTIVTLDGVTGGARLPLYSRQLNVTNNGSYPGGMLTYITVT